MTRKVPTLTELLDAPDGTKFFREWYCKVPPADVRFQVVRSEWLERGPDGLPVQQMREIRTLIPCAAPKCDMIIASPRRRFCSDKCARRARRHEKNVENPEFGQAAVRMIRAMARRIGANDIATFGMMWDFQDEIAKAVVEAIDGLRDKGFSWADLADEIGVSRNAVSQWHKRHLEKESAGTVNQEFTAGETQGEALAP